jgi:hypothetical protein
MGVSRITRRTGEDDGHGHGHEHEHEEEEENEWDITLNQFRGPRLKS